MTDTPDLEVPPATAARLTLECPICMNTVEKVIDREGYTTGRVTPLRCRNGHKFELRFKGVK